MIHNGKPIEGIVFQRAGSTMIRVESRDTVIHKDDVRQSGEFWIRKRLIEESFTLSQEDKEALIWLPSSVREELLEKWHQKRQDLINYCLARITCSEKDVRGFLGDDF